MRWNLNKSVLSPLMAVAANILLLYVVYSIARVEFWLENRSYFTQSVADGSLWTLFKGGVVFDTPGIFYTNALYILLMLLPFHLKERPGYYRVCKWIFIVVNSLALILNLADSVYFSYTLRRTTTEIFGEFSAGESFGRIISTEALRHWYLILLAVAVIWGMWKLYVNPSMEIKRQNLTKYYVVSALSLTAGAVTCVSGIRGGFLNHWPNYIAAGMLAYLAWRLLRDRRNVRGLRKMTGIFAACAALVLLAMAPIGGWRHRDIRPISLSNANAYTSRPTETALVLNTPFTLLRTIGKTEFQDPHYFDDKTQLDAVYSPLHKPASVSGRMRRKNVVIIIIESFGREYIGGFTRGVLGEGYKGYTPFTDSLINHSATWRHSFCNGRKSIDGMPSILAGIPMFVKPFILTPQALNHLDGIPSALRSKGWQTAFFHGARTGSMGFDGFAKSIGFEKYYGREDYERDNRFDGAKDFDGYWAIWDEPFLQFYAAKMSEMKEPFMTAVFTASSHHPFRIPTRYAKRFPEEGMPIHKCIRYTDNALRRFFDTARKQKWFDNTIFVITSDHTNMSAYPEFKSDIGGFSAPVIIYDPSGEIKPGMREGIAQQTDIMPTILGHLGYDRPYVAFGCDLLTTPDAGTWAVNYLNGVYQYVKNGYVLQFDGSKVIGLYAINDYRMEHDLRQRSDLKPMADGMERELKGMIQSYMDRMRGDALSTTKEKK